MLDRERIPMIPEYLAFMIALAAFAYTIDSLVGTWLMIKGYQDQNQNKDKNQGLGVLFQ